MPQVTRFFMALQWTIWTPVCALLFLKYARPSEQSVVSALKTTRSRWWYFVLMPGVAVALFWGCFILPQGLSSGPADDALAWVIVAMGRSRFILGLAGSTMAMMAGFAIIAFFRSFSMIRLAYRVRTDSPFYRKDRS